MDHGVDRVGQVDKLAKALHHAVDPLVGQSQAVDHGFAETVLLGRVQVFLVLLEQKFPVGLKGSGDCLQGIVLVRARGPGKSQGSLSGPKGKVVDDLGYVLAHFDGLG